jgi:hypothetical protein
MAEPDGTTDAPVDTSGVAGEACLEHAPEVLRSRAANGPATRGADSGPDCDAGWLRYVGLPAYATNRTSDGIQLGFSDSADLKGAYPAFADAIAAQLDQYGGRFELTRIAALLEIRLGMKPRLPGKSERTDHFNNGLEPDLPGLTSSCWYLTSEDSDLRMIYNCHGWSIVSELLHFGRFFYETIPASVASLLGSEAQSDVAPTGTIQYQTLEQEELRAVLAALGYTRVAAKRRGPIPRGAAVAEFVGHSARLSEYDECGIRLWESKADGWNRMLHRLEAFGGGRYKDLVAYWLRPESLPGP